MIDLIKIIFGLKDIFFKLAYSYILADTMFLSEYVLATSVAE